MRQKKKSSGLIKFFITGSILISSFTYGVFADSSEGIVIDSIVVGQVGVPTAEVLAEPYMNAQIADNLSEGYPARVLGVEGDFYKISFGDREAYIYRNDFVVMEAESVINDTPVNIREYPSPDGEVIGKASKNEGYTAKGVYGDWYMIEYGGRLAYVHKDYLDGSLLSSLTVIDPSSIEVQRDDDVFAVVESGSGLNLRNEASLDGEVIKVLRSGAVLDVIDEEEEWLAVDYNGTTGYVNMEYVSVVTGERPDAVSSKAEGIIAYAKQFLGTPYKYAGTNLTSGVDCSGFVYSVMKNFGISLNRSSRDMVRNGEPVSKAQLAAGDLVFFDTNSGANNGNISHVGIYIGNGNFIHSSSSQRTWGVVISNLGEDYYTRNYVSAVRILK